MSVGLTAPEERSGDHVCSAIIRQEGFQKGSVLITGKACWQHMKKGRLCINSSIFFPPDFAPPKLLTHYSSSSTHSHTHTPADCCSHHQSMMERGTSLAGEDRGEGGWNHLDAAVERELLRLSGWGERGWKKRERQEGEKGRGERVQMMGEWKSTWARKLMSGGKTRSKKQTRLEPQTHDRCPDVKQNQNWAGWWRFPDNICGVSCVRESLFLPPIIVPSLPRSPVSAGQAAVFDRLNTAIVGNQRDEMWGRCDVLNMMKSHRSALG